MVGRRFKYKKTLLNGVDDYDRVVCFVLDSEHVVTSNGVLYPISQIEFEPIEIIRNRKLKDLGIDEKE